MTKEPRTAGPGRLVQASFESFPDAFLQINSQGWITAWNGRAEDLFGYPSEKALGQSFAVLALPAAGRVPFDQALQTFFEADRQAQRMELVALSSGGREFSIELTFFAVRDAEAEAAGILAREVSSEKSIEEEAEKRLHSLIDQLGEEYFETDLRGNYVFANTRLSEYYHVKSGAELAGKNFRSYFNAEDIQMLREGFHDVYMTGQRKRQEFSIVLNGRLIYVEHTISLKRDAYGQPVGFMVLSRDCTERKLAQMQLAKAIEAAEAASRAKSEFLANMSHEIRTPLSGVLGTLELAQDTGLNAEQNELLGMASASANALLTVINDILDFSKIEAGKLEFEQVEFELREVLAEALRSLAVRAHQKGLELAYEVAPGIPRFVLGDPTRLKQVLLNITGNAIKFTERGEVLVRVDLEEAAEPGNYVNLRFTIADTGIGIDEAKRKVIFEPFSQADSSTTRRYGGTGLGLTISARLVRLMGGEIHADSEPGRGSTFYFNVKLQAVPGAGLSTASADREWLRGRRVLIVDDHATNRRMLDMLLRSWEMLPTAVPSGEAALEILQSQAAQGLPFELVLTDCHMPGMDGFELVERIQKSTDLPPVQIMMLTSDNYQDSASRCRALGIAKHLIKPIKQSELFTAMCAVVRSSSEPPQARRLDQRAGPRRPSLRILVAEDNLVNQRLATRMLEKLGHAVTVANNGREALEQLKMNTFDLVLMDVQMPEMDGFAAAAAIREKERGLANHLPIIALTAHAMTGDRQLCLDAGMDDYLPKPIDSRQLEATIDRVLQARVRSGGG